MEGMWIRDRVAYSVKRHFILYLNPCLSNRSRARLRVLCCRRPTAGPRATLSKFWTSPGRWQVACLVKLRPLRLRQIPHEDWFLSPKYFFLSGVSKDITPMRGNNNIDSPAIQHLNPSSARASILASICPIQVCRRWWWAALYCFEARNPSGTSMKGRYPTSPTAIVDDELVFMTCTWIGVQLRDPKPSKPPSQLRLIRATRPDACCIAARRSALYWMPAPWTTSPVAGWRRVDDSQWTVWPASISASQRVIHTYNGSMNENSTLVVDPGKSNSVKSICFVVVIVSQKFPAVLTICMCVYPPQEYHHHNFTFLFLLLMTVVAISFVTISFTLYIRIFCSLCDKTVFSMS